MTSRGDNSGSRNDVLKTYQSDAGSAGIFSRRTNQTQEARVYYSHDGPTCSRDRSKGGKGASNRLEMCSEGR
eukprot:2438505-Pyramimonas_sp.AAC.1